MDLPAPFAPGARTRLLETTGLSKAYGSHTVLSDVRFTLDRGQSVAVIGENGAGKSTFAKILAGVIRHPPRGGHP